MDLALQHRQRHPGPVRGPTVAWKEPGGHRVDALVGALRGQDRRDQQLERRREGERGARVRIGLRQPGQDLAGPRLLVRETLGHQRDSFVAAVGAPFSPTSSRPRWMRIGAIDTGIGSRRRRGVGSKFLTIQSTRNDGRRTPP